MKKKPTRKIRVKAKPDTEVPETLEGLCALGLPLARCATLLRRPAEDIETEMQRRFGMSYRDYAKQHLLKNIEGNKDAQGWLKRRKGQNAAWERR